MSDGDDERDELALTDADWAELTKLRRIWETEGTKALAKAFNEMNPARCLRIMAACFPEQVSSTMKDWMAKKGITEDDLKQMMRSGQNTFTKH